MSVNTRPVAQNTMHGASQINSSTPSAELIRACVSNPGAEAWSEFVSRFHPMIVAVAVRTARQCGAIPTEVRDDLVQEVYLKLCRLEGGITRESELQNPDGMLGFLRVVTANVVRDRLRTERAAKRGSGEIFQPIDGWEGSSADSSFGSLRFIELKLLMERVDQCLRKRLTGRVGHRDRAIFWMYYRGGMTARGIAVLPTVQLGAKGVESVILRLTRIVREELSGRHGKSFNAAVKISHETGSPSRPFMTRDTAKARMAISIPLRCTREPQSHLPICIAPS